MHHYILFTHCKRNFMKLKMHHHSLCTHYVWNSIKSKRHHHQFPSWSQQSIHSGSMGWVDNDTHTTGMSAVSETTLCKSVNHNNNETELTNLLAHSLTLSLSPFFLFKNNLLIALQTVSNTNTHMAMVQSCAIRMQHIVCLSPATCHVWPYGVKGQLTHWFWQRWNRTCFYFYFIGCNY